MRAVLWFALVGCAGPDALIEQAPVPGPGILFVRPGEAYPGQPLTLDISGATPSAPVVVAGSIQGESAQPTICPQAINFLCLNLLQPRVIAQGQADANGAAHLVANVPAAMAVGQTIWFQGASAAGRSSKVGVVTSTTVLDPACPQIIQDFLAEAQAVRQCTSPGQCGQVLQGTSCGCTRDWVARSNANTTRFYQLKTEAEACGYGLISTCDCPQTYGFDCVQQQCQWDYTP